MSLIKSSFKIGFLTFLSRAVGYFRESLIAKILGAGAMSDSFFVAFRLPNLFRSIFAEGAFNAAFVPMFAKITDEEEQRKFAGQVFSFLTAVLLIITIIAELAMPALVYGLASGFKEDPTKFDLTVALTRITFPYLLFISLVSLQGGILNTKDKFSAAAFAPVLMNLTMIVFLLGLKEFTETPAHALSWGVFAAGITQFIYLYYSCVKAGFRLKVKKPEINPQIKTLLKRMLPVAIGAGVLQINVFINTQMASHLADGSVSYLYFADRLSQLPLAIIGTAIGTALLPMLSKLLREGKSEEANKLQNRGFEFSWLLALPSAVALTVIAEPIVQLLFERGKFGAGDTISVTHALVAYSFGIPAFVLMKIFTPGFYSYEDTKTPVYIAVFCILINVVLSATLLYGFGANHVGLAVSTSVSSWINAILLYAVLHKRGIFQFEKNTLVNAVKILIASLIMAVVLYFAYAALIVKFGVAASLVVTMAVGGLVYFAVASISGALDVKYLLQVLKTRKI